MNKSSKKKFTKRGVRRTSRPARSGRVFDLVVIGAGPAGLTAGIYGSRAGLKVLVLKDAVGSNLKRIPGIYNYLGFPGGITGPRLLSLGTRHAKKYGALLLQEEVVRLMDLRYAAKSVAARFKGAALLVRAAKNEYGARNLLIAAGMRIKSAGIEDEFKFIGKGVAVCVACDGPFFKNKKVMMVGDGNLAASEALELLAHTKKIVINLNGRRGKMSSDFKRKLAAQKIMIVNRPVARVVGGKWVNGVEYLDGATEEIEGLFLSLGTASAVDFAKSLGLVMDGQAIKTDRDGRTNLENVWAAGDVTGPPRQVGKSVGDAVRATIDIIEKIRGGAYVDHVEK